MHRNLVHEFTDLNDTENFFWDGLTAEILGPNDKINEVDQELTVKTYEKKDIADALDQEKGPKHGLGILMLGLTRNCNLGCEYCPHMQNNASILHKNLTMDQDVAMKSVDYYLKNTGSSGVDDTTIKFSSFGEPTMARDLILRITEYAIRQDPDINFSLITNGTIMDDELACFLAKNNFGIQISLDGDQKTHDNHRKTKNEKPTHQKIMTTLETLSRYYGDDYNHMISFTPVVTFEGGSLKRADDFFTEEPLVCNNPLGPIPVNSWSYVLNEFSQNVKHAMRLYVEEFPSDRRLIRALFDRELGRIHRRPIGPPKNGIINANGICVPGHQRFFVSPEGSLHPCERVGYQAKIGHIETGVDINAIYQLMKNYTDMSRECTECWAHRLCGNCYMTFCLPKEEINNRRENICDNTRMVNEKMLSLYVSAYLQNSQGIEIWDL